MEKYRFFIDFPGELAAGLRSYSDEIEITIKSGDPGGEKGEFEEYIVGCLKEWYDGAYVKEIPEGMDLCIDCGEPVDLSIQMCERCYKLEE